MEREDYLGASDQSAAPPGPDELRAIVARAGRKRGRLALSAVAVALLLGAGAGYAVSDNTHHGGSLAATSGNPTTTGLLPYMSSSEAGGTASSGVAASGLGEIGGQAFTRLFTRSVGQIDIRGYLTNFRVEPAMEAACGVIGGPEFQADVSTPAMVGILDSSFTTSSSAITASDAGVLGVAEGSPTAVVVVGSTSAVSKVRMAFANGAVDEMAPVEGWSALSAPETKTFATNLQAHPNTALGTLYAYNSAGQAVEVEQLFQGANSPVPNSASCTGCPPMSSGSAGSASGSTGSAAVGSSSTTVVLPAVTAPSTAKVHCASAPPTTYVGSKPATTTTTPATSPSVTIGPIGPPITVGPSGAPSGSR